MGRVHQIRLDSEAKCLTGIYETPLEQYGIEFVEQCNFKTFSEEFWIEKEILIKEVLKKIEDLRRLEVKRRQEEFDQIHKEILYELSEWYWFPIRLIDRSKLNRCKDAWKLLISLTSRGKLKM